MVSLFKLDGEVFDLFLPTVKEKLMTQDEDFQVGVIEQISDFFRNRDVLDKEIILAKLINFDVISTIYDELQIPSNRLLPSILELLLLLSIHQKFYEDAVAMGAIDSMLKVAYCISQSNVDDKIILEKLVQTICDILRRGTEFGLDLDVVCVPQQILLLLKTLIIENTSDYKLRFWSIILLNLILENISPEGNSDEVLIYHLCNEALNLMNEIVRYSDEETSIARAAQILCCTCAAGTRYCCLKDERSGGVDDKLISSMEASTKAIYSTMMNTIIPYAKKTDFTEANAIKFHRNLVTCLNNLYKLESCNHDNLSNHLTGNGYLKHFLRLTVTLPEQLRRSTCMLISRILTTLADKTMFINICSGGTASFSNLIYHGLLNLPINHQEWMNVIKHPGTTGTALLMLIYYNYHGTEETDMISLNSLILRILNISLYEPLAMPTLKALWFLFAVVSIKVSIKRLAPNLERDYNRAAKQLANILQCSKLHECYTHHVDLLHYSLKYMAIPMEFRCRILSLWLIKSNGDIKPLLSFDCDKAVHHCLLALIRNGQSETVINLSVKGIRELINVDHAKEFSETAWQMLPGILSTYRSDTDKQIEAVLELANISVPNSLPLCVVYHCAENLVFVILNKAADLKLRTLAVMQAYVLLVLSVTRKSYNVLDKYINTPELLKELLAQSFSKDALELSAVSLKLLGFIIHCNPKSGITCGNPLIIEIQSLTTLLINAKKSPRALLNGVQFVSELFAQETDGSVIGLSKGTSDNTSLINLYITVYILHGNSNETQGDLIFQCLLSILRFCHKNVETLMKHMCSLMSNYDLVTRVIIKRLVSPHFLEFLSTWLCYHKEFSEETGSGNPRSLCKTPFEETLDLIKKCLDNVTDSKKDVCFYRVCHAMSFFSNYLLSNVKEQQKLMSN